MQMQMEDRLLRPRPAVKYRPVICVTKLTHNFRRYDEQPPHQFPVSFFNIVERGDYLLGDDQNMHRRLRPDVVDRDILIVFVGDLRGDLPGDDFLKKCLGHSRDIEPVPL